MSIRWPARSASTVTCWTPAGAGGASTPGAGSGRRSRVASWPEVDSGRRRGASANPPPCGRRAGASTARSRRARWRSCLRCRPRSPSARDTNALSGTLPSRRGRVTGLPCPTDLPRSPGAVSPWRRPSRRPARLSPRAPPSPGAGRPGRPGRSPRAPPGRGGRPEFAERSPPPRLGPRPLPDSGPEPRPDRPVCRGGRRVVIMGVATLVESVCSFKDLEPDHRFG